MNKVTVKVDKIRSYQTLVYKNGNTSFKKKEYKEYQRIICLQLANLSRFESDKQLSIYLHFKCKNKVVGDIDNITKPILDTLQDREIFKNDKQVVELHAIKSFGHKNNSIEIEIKEK